MEDFFMLLADIDEQVKGLHTFWARPHSPQAAAMIIQNMESYEENLCNAIHDGDSEEKQIAMNAYHELLPLLRNKVYKIDDSSTPVEALDQTYYDDS